MKKKILLLTVTLLLVFGIVQVAAATEMGINSGPYMPGGEKWTNKVEALDLTDQQLAKMREINQDTYAKTRELRIKLMDSKHELKQLRLQKNPDKAKIDAKIKEIKDLREKLHGVFQQSKEQCQSLLTQEQRDKMKQLRGPKGNDFKGNSN